MTLNFPNQSRSLELGKNRVRFWGYDGAIEITFFVSAEVLTSTPHDFGNAETTVLQAFDLTIDRIHKAADKVYQRRRDQAYAYIIEAEDF